MRYTELDGEPLLYDPITRSVHRLSPAAAVVWLRLDGRPLGEVAVDGDLPAAIELVRRLRALGVAEDAPADAPAPAPVAVERTTVRWPARLLARDAALVLVLDGDERPGIELDSATRVPVGGDRAIDEVWLAHADAAPRHPRTRRAGLDALRAAVEVLPPSWFAPDDALDRLADLIDAVDVVDGR